MRSLRTRAATLLILFALSVFGCARRHGGVEGASVQAASAQATDSLKVTLTYEQRKGHRLFIRYCATCHGSEGAGDGFNAYSLNPKPRDLSDARYQRAVSDGWLTEVITQGGHGVNRSSTMPPWGHTLTENQIREMVAFLRTLPERPASP